LDGNRQPFPVVQTEFDEPYGQFSPDGHWIAYESNKSGRPEIYVQPFPGPAAESQISASGGAQVRWQRDGKGLFYIGLDERLMAVSIRVASDGDSIEADVAVPLFATHVGGALQPESGPLYMVSPDGQRFLMNALQQEASTSPITVILNWAGALKK
jgi:serine/threonine-protein kinase